MGEGRPRMADQRLAIVPGGRQGPQLAHKRQPVSAAEHKSGSSALLRRYQCVLFSISSGSLPGPSHLLWPSLEEDNDVCCVLTIILPTSPDSLCPIEYRGRRNSA